MPGVFLFTHNDLDGAACAVLCRIVFKDIQMHFCNYDNINKELKQCLYIEIKAETDKLNIPRLLITDICPSDKILQQIHNTPYFTVGLFDHHKTKEKILEKYSWARFDKTKCGAELIFDFLNTSPTIKHEKLSQEVEAWVKAVSAWDLWKLDSKYRQRGEKLNSLCFFLGMKEFVNVFYKNINADRLPEYRNLIRQLEHNKKVYVDKIIKEQLRKSAYCMGMGFTYKILIASDYISELGNAALAEEDSKDLHFIAIVNPLNNTISFRSRQGENVDVAAIAKRLGGGGHRHSAGAPIPLGKLTKDTAYKLIKNKE